MKIKIVPAYEPESSNTIRLTPHQIAVLLNKCNLDMLETVMSEFIGLTKMYKPEIIVKNRIKTIRDLIK